MTGLPHVLESSFYSANKGWLRLMTGPQFHRPVAVIAPPPVDINRTTGLNRLTVTRARISQHTQHGRLFIRYTLCPGSETRQT